MNIPASVDLNPKEGGLSGKLDALTGRAGIYLLSFGDAQPHLAWSAHLHRRLKRLLVPANTESEGRGVLGRIREGATSAQCWITGSKLETSILMLALARRYFPEDYLKRLRLRMPWFLSSTDESGFARLTVRNRVSARRPSFGPFQSRDAAQHYEEELLGLFQIRRCTEVLIPSPDHPGCMYGEMNLCLRPCQCAVTPQEYASETARLRDFLNDNGRAALTALSVARDRACDAMEFEQAAQLHKRLEKVKVAAQAREEVIEEAHQMNGVALTRSASKLDQPLDRQTLKLWPMLHGYWQEPVELNFDLAAARPKSLDRELREQLEIALGNRREEGSRTEALAVFSRWYYSSWRDGHWFAFRTLNDLNYRRLVREISAMLKNDRST